jgi:phage terminase large subunit-like protein
MNESVAAIAKAKRREALLKLTDAEAAELLYSWEFWARPDQLPPKGDWRFWLILAGRGYGKTRVGAEWVRKMVKVSPYINLLGPTADDARDIMVQGESGILAVCPKAERPIYKKGDRKLIWPNGATSLIFTADEPDRLRGKQHSGIWVDEIAAFRYEEAWDQAKFGLRLGTPQALLTTTPRPTKQIRDLLTEEGVIVTRGSTYDNRDNLAPSFFKQIIKKYEGTRLGRQELNAEILDDNPNALWQRALIDATRVSVAPEMKRIVVAVDVAVTSTEESNYTGIIVIGIGVDNHGYVLADRSILDSPDKWGRAAIDAYHEFEADRVIGEVNNGGDLIEHLLRTIDPNVSYKAVRASRGKTTRAEPIAALYEQKRIHHVGSLPKLEDELCNYDPTIKDGADDRMDALVWGASELFLEERAEGGGVFNSPWKTWEGKSAPTCDEIIQAAHIDVTDTKITWSISTFGRFIPANETSVRPEGQQVDEVLTKPAVIMLAHHGGSGSAAEFTAALRDAYEDNDPDFLLIAQSNDSMPVIKHLRHERMTVKRIKYDPQTSPQIAAETLSSGRAWIPKKEWAKAVKSELARYPFGDRTVTAHSISLILLWLRHMGDVHPVFDEDDAPEPDYVPKRAIYG